LIISIYPIKLSSYKLYKQKINLDSGIQVSQIYNITFFYFMLKIFVYNKVLIMITISLSYIFNFNFLLMYNILYKLLVFVQKFKILFNYIVDLVTNGWSED
jgi:hypothetical protein